MYDLVRNRAGLSWLTLIAATLLSFVIGVDHDAGAVVVIAVLGIALFKVRLIGLDFMELRHAPLALRALFETYCALQWVVLSGLYLWA